MLVIGRALSTRRQPAAGWLNFLTKLPTVVNKLSLSAGGKYRRQESVCVGWDCSMIIPANQNTFSINKSKNKAQPPPKNNKIEFKGQVRVTNIIFAYAQIKKSSAITAIKTTKTILYSLRLLSLLGC